MSDDCERVSFLLMWTPNSSITFTKVYSFSPFMQKLVLILLAS